MSRKRIEIDPDLWKLTEEYVERQLETMRKFDSAPTLTTEAYCKLVYDCAKYPQEIRNLIAKEKRKTLRAQPTPSQPTGGAA
jgi:hypothetical protein